ncbi:MAG TPA: tripartite tricarboxylate transporter substrate binding protein [Burkholderiales bacterium]|nr:tripartite tricarboxylate transporter substrate binding protein [Burkholderiales bacterium]
MKFRYLLLTVLTAVPALPSPVYAQAYPAKSIRLVLPFAAGSAVDALARIYGQKMTETWKQQVAVDNRTGANGIIGTEIAARAPADGYTLYMGNVATLAINPNLYQKLPFDVVRDFAPITLVAAINSCLIVHPSLPVKNVKELVALAKARPGQLNYASGGVGSAQHIPMEMLKSMTGINIVHVSYKGLTPAFNDVVAGQVPMMIPGVVTALPLHQAGRLRIIATTAAKRTAATPDIPTIAESGVPGFDWDSWTGFLAPAGTPPQVIARVHAEVVRITRLPETSEKLPGFEWIGSTPQEFGSYIKANLARIGKVVREANIKAE